MLAQLDRNGAPLWFDVSGAGPRVALGRSRARLERHASAGRGTRCPARGVRGGHVQPARSGPQRRRDNRRRPSRRSTTSPPSSPTSAAPTSWSASRPAARSSCTPRRGSMAPCIVLLEPAIDDRPDSSGLRERVAGHIRHGDPATAVLDFYTSIGTPEEIVDAIRGSDVWPDLVRSAPTLLADIDLSHVDDRTAAAVDTPVHVIVSDGSPPRSPT